MGPWKLIRLVLRVVVWGVAGWLVLAALWAGLPSPSSEHDGDNGIDYPTSVLSSGKVLTRVYRSRRAHLEATNSRRYFALSFQLHAEDMTLSVSGVDTRLSLLRASVGTVGLTEPIQNLNATAQVGDGDGANLPWFETADAALLFWQIHRENVVVPLTARWTAAEDLQVLAITAGQETVLEIRIQPNNPVTISAAVPKRPDSSSPSRTYPIRVLVICVLAPTSVFFNDYFTGFFSTIIFSVLFAFTILIYPLVAVACVVSLWRCMGGVSLEALIGRTRLYLENLDRYETLLAPLMAALTKMQAALTNEGWVQWAFEICKDGWHPERTRARRMEAEIDIEKEASSDGPQNPSEFVGNPVDDTKILGP